MNNNFYKKQIKEFDNNWDNLLEFDFKSDLLKLSEKLEPYYKEFIENSELVAVIPALPKSDDKQFAYFSCPTIDMEKPENMEVANLMPRLSPAFIIDNSQKILKDTKNLFEVGERNIPKFMDYKTPNFYEDRIFLFDTESSRMYNYQSKESKYIKSELFDDMLEHIIKNPVVLFFKGCDDGHTGLRFPTKDLAIQYLNDLTVFEDIFDLSNKNFDKEILNIKKSTNENVSGLIFKNLEYHN